MRKWTAERDALFRDVYLSAGRHAAAKALAVTLSAIKNRARVLDLRRPVRNWTEAEDAVIRTDYAAGVTAGEIAKKINRGLTAVRARARKLGVASGRMWLPEQIEAVRSRYRTDGARSLALELLGKDDPLAVWLIYRLAERIGVSVPLRHSPEVYDRVRSLHALGRNDSQIAKEMADYFPGRNDRERVTAIRRRMRLPAIKQTPEQMRENGRRTRAAQIAAGVNPRDQAFAKLARSYGLPEDTPPRAVEIVLALVSGPKTLPELETAGCKPSLLWNAIPSSYVGGLVRRGLVAAAKAPGATNRGPRLVYYLTAAAMEMLAKGGVDAARVDA